MVCNWGPGQIGCGNSYYRSLGYQIGRVERLRWRWVGGFRHACSCWPGRRFRMRKQRHVLRERPHEEAQLVEDLW